MESVGVDLHKIESQICVWTEEGKLIEQRILTRPDRFADVLGQRPHARVLLEASTESEWVARCIEKLEHEVVVADPNYAPMYARRDRKVKTDRRDARALAEACRTGTYREVHRVSDTQRRVRAELAVRDALVRTRSRYISLVRSLMRGQGYRIREGGAEGFVMRVQEVALPEELSETIAPVLRSFSKVSDEIEVCGERIEEIAKNDEVIQRLRTVPGVGPVTAVAFRAALDDVNRFDRAHEVGSYVGLVPREYSSGEKQRRGRITKAGNTRVRRLLVEAAWGILLRKKNPKTEVLRYWAEGIAVRRGKQIAVVALARRLAGILFAIWRDGTEYHQGKLRAAELETRRKAAKQDQAA